MDDKEWVLKVSVMRAMLKLGLPIAVIQALHITYNLTDMFWLGRLGRNALAAINATWPIIFLVISGLAGLLQAGISLVSQYWGAREYNLSMRAAGQVILIVLLTGIPITLAAYIAIQPLLQLLGVPHEVIPDAVTYGRIFALGFITYGLMDSAILIFSATGDTVTPMKVTVVGVLMNVVLDPILIFGLGPLPHLGIAGAAIATLISNLIAISIIIYLLVRGTRWVNLSFSHLKPHQELLKKLIRIGLPISISSVGEAAGFTVLAGIISLMGSAALASWGIGDRPLGLLDIFVGSLLSAATTMIGQSLGAEMLSRAKKVVYRTLTYGVLITSTGILSYILLRFEIVSLFTPSDVEVIQNAADFVLYMGPSIIFFTILRTAFAIATASGHTKIIMFLSILRLWVLRNALAYLFGPGPLNIGVKGLWIGMSISNVIAGLLALGWILRCSWLKPIIKPINT